jgi:hypothetical protein
VRLGDNESRARESRAHYGRGGSLPASSWERGSPRMQPAAGTAHLYAPTTVPMLSARLHIVQQGT